jgi:hypothetical protein
MDHFAYLEQKSTSAGIKITKAQFHYASDTKVYLLEKAGRLATVSLSGLEMLQNSKDEQIQDLIDTRFGKALEHLNSPLISDSQKLSSSNAYANALRQQQSRVVPDGFDAMKNEIASLRNHITGLEIENARLNRELLAARMPVIHAVDIVQAKPDTDRIWDALRLAATS